MPLLQLKRARLLAVPAYVRTDGRVLTHLKRGAVICAASFLIAVICSAAGGYLICIGELLLLLPFLRHGLKLAEEKRYFAALKPVEILSVLKLLRLMAAGVCGSQGKGKDAVKVPRADAAWRRDLCRPLYWQEEEQRLLTLLRSQVFLGEGFIWDSVHLTAYKQLYLRREQSSFFDYPRAQVMHGLGRDEMGPLFMDSAHLTTHALVFGTTGSGKSTLLALLMLQALLRRECVIVLDPKSDSSLMSKVYEAAALIGRQDEVHLIDLSGLISGDRLNPLSRFKRSSEIAERITSTMSADGAASTFKAYAQNAVSAAVSLLRLRGMPITLDNIRAVTAQHINFKLGLVQFFEDKLHEINDAGAYEFYNRLRGLKKTEDPEEVEEAEAAGPNSYHEKRRDGTDRPPFIKASAAAAQRLKLDGLIKLYQWLCRKGYLTESENFYAVCDIAAMAPDFYAKVTASLKPRLNLLTNSDLRLMLSDSEQSLSLGDLISQGGILYLALSCLSDASLGAEVGKLVMADLRAIAGSLNAKSALKLSAQPAAAALYELSQCGRINVFIDEASEIIDESTIQLLNKGRSSNFALTLATQSFADLTARLGESGARQVLANCNTLISLRIFDDDSAQAVASSFPQVPVEDVSYSINYQEGALSGLRYGGGKGVDYEQVSLIPAELLANLPNFHYVARLADGRIVKGRIPIIDAAQPGAEAGSGAAVHAADLKHAANSSSASAASVSHQDDPAAADFTHLHAAAGCRRAG